MIPVELIEANDFRIQEKTYGKYMMYNWLVHCFPSFYNAHDEYEPPVNAQEVQLKIRYQKNSTGCFPQMGLSSGVETKQEQ